MTNERDQHRVRERQKGAALVVVLLLVATLSFILLSVTTIIKGSIERSATDRARADALWKARSGEILAQIAIEKYFAASPARMAATEGIFAAPLEIAIEGGKATILFRDATRCFNINSLVDGEAGNYVEMPANIDSFIRLMESIGLGTGEATKLADVIVDNLDSDQTNRPQGAEDGFYTLLPTPYRTSGQLMRSVSELMALDGVSRAKYRRIRPYLCAGEDVSPSRINANMLRADAHAALIAALLPEGEGSDLGAVRQAIAALPPGGIAASGDLPPPLDAVPGIDVASNRIEAVVRLEVNGVTVEEKLLFGTDSGGKPRLLARTFGEDF